MNVWLKVGAITYNKDNSVPFEWMYYFQNYTHNGQIYCDMKQIVAKMLTKDGKGQEWIASFLGLRNHTTVNHYLNKRKTTPDYKNVEKHLVEWINRSVYPVSLKPKDKYKVKPLEGFTTIFKLTEL